MGTDDSAAVAGWAGAAVTVAMTMAGEWPADWSPDGEEPLPELRGVVASTGSTDELGRSTDELARSDAEPDGLRLAD